MATDVKLTKYIDGAGIQALYKKIRAKITGSTAAISGDWYADKANNIKITENQGKYFEISGVDNKLYLSGYKSLNDSYASLISTTRAYISTDGMVDSFKDTLHVDAISLGGAKTDVLLGNGSSKAISTLDVNSAQNIKSSIATGEYYILGSTSSTTSTDTPVKLSSVKVDASGNLTANGFNGPIYIGAASNGAQVPSDSNETIKYLWVSSNTTAGYSSPKKLSNLYYNHSLDGVDLDPVHGLHADQFIGKFVGDLNGNAKTATSATSATKADTLKVTAPTDDNLGVSAKVYLWGDTSSSEGYSSVLKRSTTYLSTGTTYGDQLYVGGVTVPARILASECGENELTPRAYVDWAIDNAVTAGVSSVMTIKGRYGVTTITNDLPTDPDELKTVRTGWTYIVSADGLTFAQQNYADDNAQQVDKGDMIVCVGEDTENGTDVIWTIIQRNIPEALTTGEIGDLLADADKGTA